MKREVCRCKILASAQQWLAALLRHRIDHQIKQVERAALAVARAIKRIRLRRYFGMAGIERNDCQTAVFPFGEKLLCLIGELQAAPRSDPQELHPRWRGKKCRLGVQGIEQRV